MKVEIAIFSLKRKEDIWREDVKWVGDTRQNMLSSHDFKRLFRKGYLLEGYYNSKAK